MQNSFRKIFGAAIIIVLFFSSVTAFATDEPYRARALKGSSIRKDSVSLVQDDVFFDNTLRPLQSSFAVKNLITFKINEGANLKLPDAFSVTLKFKINYTRKINDSTGAIDSMAERSLTINYDKNNYYDYKSIYTFNGGYKCEIKITDVVVNSGTLADFEASLMLENEIFVTREYVFDKQAHAVDTVQTTSYLSTKGELLIEWGYERRADEYDLEWTYIDSSALRNYRLVSDTTKYDPDKIFTDNATRVSITANNYLIPLLYDSKGHLFYRVRSVQVKQSGQRNESVWSSAFTMGWGKFDYNGHESKLNWQATTSFAEEGKRKSVVQYFDGTLRNRQTVTKDNTTDTTIIAETFYDYQGRPTIQVLPTPSISTLIKFTPNYNSPLNTAEYEKDLYDGTWSDSCYCTVAAPRMDSTYGSARYYSANNPQSSYGYNKYIPKANGFPFTETRYTADNTGRIAMQSGVGDRFRIGVRDNETAENITHDTKYFYGKADQSELDALFGTEVGNASHYFKNMVRDANGQYSVSYVDMHGRTIATALAGSSPSRLDALPSNNTRTVTKNLLDSGSNVIKGGTVIESSNGLLVTKAGNNRFVYSLSPDSISLKGCDSVPVCYDCKYELEITISDECNNATFPGGNPILITRTNVSSVFDTSCATANSLSGVDTTIYLIEGNYLVTKRLSISKKGMDTYRDSFFLRHNLCKTLDQFIEEQKEIIRQQTLCEPTCQSCQDALGTWSSFRTRFMNEMGIAASDTAQYRDQALSVYNNRLKECDDLCNNTSEATDIRKQMLADMIVPFGQYANPDNIDGFSILSTISSGKRKYSTVPRYVDEMGKSDLVYNPATGINQSPSELSKEDFIANYKNSWADSLLVLHPEYDRLLVFENMNASHLWDRRMENIKTYQSAVDSGYINTSNRLAILDNDPLFSSNLYPYYKTRFRDSLNRKVVMSTSPLDTLNAWSLATISAKCPTGDAACYTYFKNQHYFEGDTSCPGELDVAWETFRSLYLQEKKELLYKIVSENTFQLDPIPSTHFEYFRDPAQVTSGLPTSLGNANSSFASAANANCQAYAEQWMEQMAPCNFSDSDLHRIIPQLIMICKEGSDISHPFGSSSTKPGSALTYKTFEAYLKHYCDSMSIPYNATCNAYLITAPKPYDKQPVLTEVPIITKPDSCQCTSIANYRVGYNTGKLSGESFSQYIYRKTRVVISETNLQTLSKLCTGEIDCKYIKDPVMLPGIFQCYVTPPCVNCDEFKSAYNAFKTEFSGVTPTKTPVDTTDQRNNNLFREYMNRRLGYSKNEMEYLDFMDSCGTSDTACASFQTLLANYNDNTSLGRVKFYGDNGVLISNLANDVENGALRTPDSIRHNSPVWYTELQMRPRGSDICFDSTYSIEWKFKFPTNSSNSAPFYIASNNFGAVFWKNFSNPEKGIYLAAFRPEQAQGGCSAWGAHDIASGNPCYNFPGYSSAQLLAVDSSGVELWNTVKAEIKSGKYRIYFNGNLIFETNRASTAALRIGYPEIAFFGNDFSIDHIKIIGDDGLPAYFEDFENLSIPASINDSALCDVPTQTCQTRFTNYYNTQRGTSYSYSQIDSIYQKSCGRHLAVCGFTSDPMLCGGSEPAFPLTAIEPHGPCDDSTSFAIWKGTLLFESYRDSVLSSFEDKYLAKCLKARYLESFAVTQTTSEYHYTLYYYDQAGNLVKTVPPEGVDLSKFSLSNWSDTVKLARSNKQTRIPSHGLITNYRYNTLNQVVSQKTPDAGISEFWYDRLGRLSISRNAKQKSDTATSFYSYTKYDYLGRITEVGQIKNTTASDTMKDVTSRDQSLLDSWLLSRNNLRGQITETVYDIPFSEYVGLPSTTQRLVITQRNLRNRVSYVRLVDTGTHINHSAATAYTYDVHGNVDTLLQDYGRKDYALVANVMNQNDNRWKKTVYKYDLISGKVNMVIYQPGWGDQWIHRYSYDAENRLTLVETSRDSLVWEKEARYKYYLHGPLARMVIGEQLLQGVDYAYTLQGWLKGVNSTSGRSVHDMGADGRNSGSDTLNRYVAKDALSYTLNYFRDDYSAANNSVLPFPYSSSYLNTAYRPLFNGNISSMVTTNRKLNDANMVGGPVMLYNYKYDQLNRLTAMDSYNGFDTVNNTWSGSSTALASYNERISYDANGNILKYLRNGNTYNYGPVMDSLTYKYYPGTNKLSQVTDRDASYDSQWGSNSWEYNLDIDHQTSSTNYKYDSIGNLISDAQEGITSIKWNVYGKIQEINRTATSQNPVTKIIYKYDPQGNRIAKIVSKNGTSNRDFTWYTRDAQGNVMSVYTVTGAKPDDNLDSMNLVQAEKHIYGSSRLGINSWYEPMGFGGYDMNYFSTSTYKRGWKQYELSNHLGNILATISDKKFGIAVSGSSQIDYYEPDIVAAQDYYPFGMLMPKRSYVAATGYRYGFNGKENDNDVKGLGNQQDYGMRIYDPRIGKFLSFDILSKEYPDLSPYHFAGNNPIQNLDLDGGEPKDFRQYWKPLRFSVNGSKPGYYHFVDDPKLGYILVEAYYDNWSKQSYFVHEGNDGRNYYWKHNPGADQTIRVAGNGLWEEFKTQNRIQYENTVALTKGISATVAALVSAPFIWAGIAEGGASLWAASKESILDATARAALMYYRSLPVVAAIGKAGAELIDESGTIGAQNQGVTFPVVEVLSRTFLHISSRISNGTFKVFGQNEGEILRTVESIVKDNIKSLKEGHNNIETTIKGLKGTVTAFVKDGEIKSVDAMGGLRVLNNAEKVNTIQDINGNR